MSEPDQAWYYQRVAQVFDRAMRNHKKIFTRFRGGFTYVELFIAGGFIALCIFVIGYQPVFLIAVYLWVGFLLVMAKRRLKTDHREFEDWVKDVAAYHWRRHPFRARRRVSGKAYHLPPKIKQQTRITVSRRGDKP